MGTRVISREKLPWLGHGSTRRFPMKANSLNLLLNSRHKRHADLVDKEVLHQMRGLSEGNNGWFASVPYLAFWEDYEIDV